MSVQFYPPLSSIMSLEDLPEALSFLTEPLTDIFNKVYFRDLQQTKGPKGDSAFYSLTLVSYKEIGFEIPGTGITLVLNPPANNTIPGITEVPVTLHYEWKVLRIARAFNLESFPWDPVAFFNLISELLDVPPVAIIGEAIEKFVGAGDVNGYVDDLNGLLGTSLAYPPSGSLESQITNVKGQVEQVTGISAVALLFPLYINDPSGNNALDNLGKLFQSFLGGKPVGEFVKNLLLPKVDVSIGTGVGLVFPRNVLMPLNDTPGPDYGKPLPIPAETILTFNVGSFRFSTEEGIGFEDDLVADLPFCGIGNTGLTLEIDECKLDVSRKKNIPEATADGRPDDFVGVYVKEAKIGLPPFIKADAANPNPPTVEIVGKNLIIGTGGFSGTIALETPGPPLCKKFGDHLQACFESFDISFRQNQITGSNIHGKLKIPGFKDAMNNDAEIDIKIHFGSDGDFLVTASETQGINLIKIPGVLAIQLKSVFVGREGGRFFIGISGGLDFESFPPPIGQFIPDTIELKKLVIWEDGKIELEGGKITLPKAITLKIGPVELSVSAIGLGSHEQERAGVMRQYKYFTFDGGIDTGPGGVDVSGKGISFYWTTDNLPLHFFVRIESIAIDIIIPGDARPEDAALLLKGYLSMKSPEGGGDGTEYAGGIEFSLPKLKMAGSAAMRMNPKVPAWIVDIGLELSTPIVLGSTGLGIYGFRALVGQRYVATKNAAGVAEDGPWWQYYKAKVADSYKEGIVVDKFEQKDGFSLGAGVSLATVPDAGNTFSSKLFFLLSLPEVFMLQGQGQILKERIGLDTTTDPPFFMLLSISSTSIEMALGVNYKIPDGGSNPGAIATVDGLMEMGFFWGNAAAWYINIGKDQPEDRRIQVRLFTLFNCYFYFMLSNQGIRAGAGASYELKKKWGPLKAELWAYLHTAGRLSFKPVQIGGSIEIGGGLELSIFGFGFGLSASASLAAEAPKPFIVSGKLKACIKIFWKKYCAKFSFTWTFNNSLDFSEIPLLESNPADSVKAINIQTKEPFEIYGGTTLPTPAQLESFYVPADSFIDIEFRKGLKPSTQVQSKYELNGQGAKYIDYVAPQRGKSDRVRHEYELVSVKIKYHDGSSWQDYDVYDAITPLSLAPFVTTNLSTLPFGYWQIMTPNLYNKLRILGQSPIEYVSQGSSPPVLEDSNISLGTIFCGDEPIDKTCTTYQDLDPGYGSNSAGEPLLPKGKGFFHGEALMMITGKDGSVANIPHLGYSHGIKFASESEFVAYFIEPKVCVDLHLFVKDLDVTVEFYERKDTGTTDSSGQPIFSYNMVQSNVVTVGSQVVTYDNIGVPVEMVKAITGKCEADPGYYYGNNSSYGGGSAGGGGIKVPILPIDPIISFDPIDLKNPIQPISPSLTENLGDPTNPDKPVVGRPIDPSRLDLDSTDLKDKPLSLSEGISLSSSLADVEDGAKLVFRSRDSKLDARASKGCDLTEEALQLQIFLNHVLDRKYQSQPVFDIWPADNGYFNSVFYNTVLYGSPSAQCSLTAINQIQQLTWCINIKDCREFDCLVCLEIPSGVSADWQNLVLLENIRCNPKDTSPGDQMTFLIDGVFNRGPDGYQAITMVGSSCYPICRCLDCRALIYEICTLNYEAAAFNLTLLPLPTVQNEIVTMINAFEGSLRPIWRFDTPFAIEVKTRDATYRESGSSLETAYDRTYFFGFRTAGPLGHFHKYLNPGGGTSTRSDYAALLAEDKEDEFKLSKLLYYIDLAKSYPNADGQLLNSKPLFYKAPKLNMFYNQPYVYSFFQDWDDYGGTLTALNAAMEVLIKDPAPDPAAAGPSSTVAAWTINSLPTITTDIQILNNLIINSGGNPCAPTATISPLAVHTEFALPDLEPLKLYTGIFNAKFKRASMANFKVREIHRYGFQTSRYGDFKEQVQSYLLTDPADATVPALPAVFSVEAAFDQVTQVDVAKLIVDPSDPMAKDDPLRQEYGHHFNRLIEGALQLEAIHPPLSTEFNVIKNTINNHILGILVKNPEPFNDPKIPLANIASTIRMSVNGGSTALNTALFSKDYSQAFLTPANLSMQLPANANVTFTFEYKLFNGSSYAVASTETVSIVIP